MKMVFMLVALAVVLAVGMVNGCREWNNQLSDWSSWRKIEHNLKGLDWREYPPPPPPLGLPEPLAQTWDGHFSWSSEGNDYTLLFPKSDLTSANLVAGGTFLLQIDGAAADRKTLSEVSYDNVYLTTIQNLSDDGHYYEIFYEKDGQSQNVTSYFSGSAYWDAVNKRLASSTYQGLFCLAGTKIVPDWPGQDGDKVFRWDYLNAQDDKFKFYFRASRLASLENLNLAGPTSILTFTLLDAPSNGWISYEDRLATADYKMTVVNYDGAVTGKMDLTGSHFLYDDSAVSGLKQVIRFHVEAGSGYLYPVSFTKADSDTLIISPAVLELRFQTDTESYLAVIRNIAGQYPCDVTDAIAPTAWTIADTDLVSIGEAGHLKTKNKTGETTAHCVLGALTAQAVTIRVNPVLKKLAITPDTAIVEVEGTQDFVLTQYFNNSTNQNSFSGVTFSLSSSEAGNVDQNTGSFTAGKVLGVYTLTASASGVAAVEAEIKVVKALKDIVITAPNVTNDTLIVGVGEKVTFEGTISYTDDTSERDSERLAYVSSDETKGKFVRNVLEILAIGNFTVHAEAMTKAGRKSSNTISVVPVSTTGGITLTPSPTAEVEVGKTLQFNVKDSGGGDITASSIFDSSIKAVGTVDRNGLFTALTKGTTKVTVKRGTVTKQCVVTVRAGVTTIALAPATLSVNVGSSSAVTPTITLSDGLTSHAHSLVQYEVYEEKDKDGNDTTGVATVNAQGNVTAVKRGTAKVRAKTGTVTSNAVTVTAVGLVTAVTLPTTLSGTVGDADAQLSSVVKFNDGSEDNGIGLVSFSTTPEGVVTVNNSNGKVHFIKKGTTVITATYGGKTSGGCAVTVGNTAASLEVTPTGVISLDTGGQPRQLTVKVVNNDNTKDDVTTTATYTPEAGTNDIFSVSTGGLVTPGTVPGVGKKITVSYGSLTPVEVLVTVGKTPATVVIAPKIVTVERGATQVFSATVGYSDNTQSTDPLSVAFTPSDTALGLVAVDGTLTTKFLGSSRTTTLTVTATAGAKSDTATVTIVLGQGGDNWLAWKHLGSNKFRLYLAGSQIGGAKTKPFIFAVWNNWSATDITDPDGDGWYETEVTLANGNHRFTYGGYYEGTPTQPTATWTWAGIASSDFVTTNPDQALEIKVADGVISKVNP